MRSVTLDCMYSRRTAYQTDHIACANHPFNPSPANDIRSTSDKAISKQALHNLSQLALCTQLRHLSLSCTWRGYHVVQQQQQYLHHNHNYYLHATDNDIGGAGAVAAISQLINLRTLSIHGSSTCPCHTLPPSSHGTR